MPNRKTRAQATISLISFCFSVLVLMLVSLHGSASFAQAIGVVGTKHNLSASGPGTLIANEEIRVCIFCHTPHHANTVGDYMPLWSRALSGANYDLYDSSTIQAEPGQPSGTSRLCLSCHDGTIALGMLAGGYRPSGNTLEAMPDGASNLTTDLTDDHPISFVYDTDLALSSDLHDPSSLPQEIRLEEGRLECSSCHDAHLDLYGMFLVMDNINSVLCESCHEPGGAAGWSASGHAPPDAKCESCHTSHSAPQSAQLLLGISEEETCTSTCHDGSGTEPNVLSAFTNFSIHPIFSTLGVHDPAEDPRTADYHVECIDCHNPHEANDTAATAPEVNGALKNVRGINSAGELANPALYQYEVCFKCHAENSFVSTPAITRQVSQVNQRLRFEVGNPSYHPVIAAGKNSSVPSLRSGYSVDSLIYCTDCHNSDAGTTAGGSGANGPHGSIYQQILIKKYEQDTYPLTYNEWNYDLCWQCHDPLTLLATDSFHQKRVVVNGIPCSVCHDPHGVPGTEQENAHLINFDLNIVSGSHDSIAQTCTVDCHTPPEDVRSY